MVEEAEPWAYIYMSERRLQRDRKASRGTGMATVYMFMAHVSRA